MNFQSLRWTNRLQMSWWGACSPTKPHALRRITQDTRLHTDQTMLLCGEMIALHLRLHQHRAVQAFTAELTNFDLIRLVMITCYTHPACTFPAYKTHVSRLCYNENNSLVSMQYYDWYIIWGLILSHDPISPTFIVFSQRH